MEKNYYVVTDSRGEKEIILLTEEQIKFLQYIEERDLLDGRVYFETIEDMVTKF